MATEANGGPVDHHRRRDDDTEQQMHQQSNEQALGAHQFSEVSAAGRAEAFPSMQEELVEGRPLSMKRVRSSQSCTLEGLFLAQAPPPDCPPYLDGRQLPLWVGRSPLELTPEKADELHNIQWRAWKEELCSESREQNVVGMESSLGSEKGGAHGAAGKDYARILEAAGSIFNSAFLKLNPHNFSITVGITVDAMYHTKAPLLACANTFLYGLSLLADNPSKQTIPIQFCPAAPLFMEVWAQETFGTGGGGEAVESLFQFCGVYPHTGLPEVLSRQVERRVGELMVGTRYKEAVTLISRLLEAPWAQGHKIWEEDVYWKLRLLSYTCKRRARHLASGSPRFSSASSSSPKRGPAATSKGTTGGRARPNETTPTVVRVVVLVFPSSSGRLPRELEEGEASGTYEAGCSFEPEELEASLTAMEAAFEEFSESFLALSKETVKWELVLDRAQCVLRGACMPARRYHREVEASTNPNRLVAQADFAACPNFRKHLAVASETDERVREAQAVLVVWPGLKAPPAAYMLTCGGITASGGDAAGGRAVFMSDGPMLKGRPVWSPMWFWHEVFHIMEHIFPEAPFAEASASIGHPCFLRDQWPDHYDGPGYEWDYYYHSYRQHILHGSAQPPLAARLANLSHLPRTRCFDISRRDTATIIARLAHPGDRIILRGGTCEMSASSGALAFKPGAVLPGLTYVSAINEGRAVAPGREEAKMASNEEEIKKEEEEERAFMAFWVSEPPCFVVTMVQGGDRAAHEALLDKLLADKPSSKSYSPRQARQGLDGSPLASSPTAKETPCMGPGGAFLALVEGPRSTLSTTPLVAYAQQKLQACTEQGICTFRATGTSWMRQAYMVCRTCEKYSVLQGNVGCCMPCSQICHKDHDLVQKEEGPFYCDCAIGGFSNMKCHCVELEHETMRHGGGRGHVGGVFPMDTSTEIPGEDGRVYPGHHDNSKQGEELRCLNGLHA